MRFFRMRTTRVRVCLGLVVFYSMALHLPLMGSSFVATRSFSRNLDRFARLQASCNDDPSNFRNSVDGDKELLFRRLSELRRDLLEQELARAPNQDLSPQDFVVNVLENLLDPYTPLPDSGFRLLLRASTTQWHQRICTMIGAPDEAPEEVIASALGSALGRPNNQFGILVNADDAEEYETTFPSDPLDFEDGTCWLECRLRDKADNHLLVVMGWDLQRRQSDGAWVINGIDWQDFRDNYRPGIGREEWMRICG